jgi:hypothetical protein
MTSGRKMLEGKLKSIAETENALARGSGKLSDLPPAKKLKAWDPWVPSLLVALLYWAGVLWHAVIGGLFGSAEVLRVLWYYLTFRPKANRYPGPRSSTKEFSFSEAVDLKDIKVVQKAFSVPGRHITLNDVMCAVVARAMIEHYAAVGAPTDPRLVCFPFHVGPCADRGHDQYFAFHPNLDPRTGRLQLRQSVNRPDRAPSRRSCSLNAPAHSLCARRYARAQVQLLARPVLPRDSVDVPRAGALPGPGQLHSGGHAYELSRVRRFALRAWSDGRGC